MGVDAPGVPVRPAAFGRGSPASAVEPHTLWLSGTGKQMRQGWHPDQITLGSNKKVHWVVQDECKLGLVHRWHALPSHRISLETGSSFPSGQAVCACNSLAVQCPEAAGLWDHQANESLTPDNIIVRSAQAMFWRAPDGNQWQQRVHEVVTNVRRHGARSSD